MPARDPAPPSEAAARRLAERNAQRAARAAEALRANLQRRKTQARERAVSEPDAIDAPPNGLQKKDSESG